MDEEEVPEIWLNEEYRRKIVQGGLECVKEEIAE
jgi:hypothetical protein